MKISRKQLRKLIMETLAVGAGREAFLHALTDTTNFSKGWSGRVDPYEHSEAEMITGYKEMVKHGSILKGAFQKAADHSFLRKLVYVHWAKNWHDILEILRNPEPGSEISCSAYLPSNTPEEGDFGPYGIIVKGTCTLLANDMDSIDTGWREWYHRAGYEENIKKGISSYDLENIVLDASEWNPAVTGADGSNRSEALIDNWSIMGFIVPSNETEQVIMDIFTESYDNEHINEMIMSQAIMINNVYPNCEDYW
jgi:hypothetical protein